MSQNQVSSQNETARLLRELGWSEELIESYSQVSTKLKETQPIMPPVPTGVVFNFCLASQNEMDLSGGQPMGSNHVSVAR